MMERAETSLMETLHQALGNEPFRKADGRRQAESAGRVQPASLIPRLALTPNEAAAAVGIGRTTFYEQVMPELRVIRLGRKRLIPMRELEAWAERCAARILD